jgi:hypothetical protein
MINLDDERRRRLRKIEENNHKIMNNKITK